MKALRRGWPRGLRLPLLVMPVLLVAGLTACQTRPPTSLVHLPPEDGWEDRLLADRRDKDRSFGEDPASPLLPAEQVGFQGLAYWDPDPELHLVGSVRFYENPEQFTIVTTAGQPRPCARIGWISFTVEGGLHRLQVYQLLDSSAEPGSAASLFLPFTDATSGKQTYPAGRYLELQGPPGGPFVVDFNRAFNPSCAYGAPERFACPVTPPENRLPIAIEAGERGYVGKPSAG